jgi:CDP-diacylglycerol--serine O-phosphatidyltransferase
MHRDDARRGGPSAAPLAERSGGAMRRGVYLLPSLFTVGNLFCGWACVVYAMRGDYATAAPFVGFAVVLDMLDGRVARMTGTTSQFGVEFDSLADLISFGMAPAVLAFQWGLVPLGRLGWAVGFIYLTAAAIRLARFNIQPVADKRYFVGMPSPAAAAVPASTIFFHGQTLVDRSDALVAMWVLLLPALLMVSTIRYRSFKTVDLGARRNYRMIVLMAATFAAIAAEPHWVLLIMAWTYLTVNLVGHAVTRLGRGTQAAAPPTPAYEAAASAPASDGPRDA